MEDYKQLMKDLFLKYYSPMGDDFQKKHTTTFEVLVMFRGIIPNEPIGEHEVFDILKELGFRQELQILYEKKCIFEGDEEKGMPPEYDEVEAGRIFKWVVYQIN